MFRTGFVFAFHLILIFIMYTLADSTISKRLQKCREYNAQVYGQAVPTCETSIGSHQAIVIEEFPHIAVFGFRHNDEKNYRWHCHGTLVSSRYVLSTGRCIQSFEYKSEVLAKVRLGATSINYRDESKSTDYDVEQIILHPNVSASLYYNDIGIVKLSQKVKFSESVRPICLPDTDLYTDRIYHVNYEATKQQIPEQKPLTKYALTFITNEKCNEIFTNHNLRSRTLPDGITDALMCNLKPLVGTTDYNCAGESGAPLYIDHPEVTCSHVQLGIGSFRFVCNNEIPEGATKVYQFVDWIESVIWPDGEDF